MNFNFNTLKENDRVAIARFGSRSCRSEGIYLVKKVNKVRVILSRESDGYEREFSMRTGIEKGSSRYRSAFIESVEDKIARDKSDESRQAETAAWLHAESCAKHRNLDELREAVRALEEKAWLK